MSNAMDSKRASFLSKFKEYQTRQNEDGTYDVLGVEIFRLGDHKGYQYTSQWGDKTAETHKALEEEGYRPSVIIGHNDGESEKPAKGFLENVRRLDDLMVADITRISPETYDALKKREYPHRSVEFINPDDNRFSALALLGGTAPYHKLPVLEVFQEHPEATWLHFDGMNLELQMQRDEKFGKIREIWWRMWEAIEQVLHSGESDEEKDDEVRNLLDQGSGMISDHASNFKEGDGMPEKTMQELSAEYTQQFKEKYGVTPEEAAEQAREYREKSRQYEEEAKNRKIQQRQDDLKAFGEKLKHEHHLSPALVDELILPLAGALPDDTEVKFGESNVPVLAAFKEVISKTVAAAEAESLFVPYGERVAHGSGDVNIGNEYREDVDPQLAALDKKAQQLMAAEPNLKYDEAIMRVVSAQ